LHGASPAVRAKAAIRAELDDWGLGGPEVDPAETMLALISQSASRVARYGSELALLEQKHGLHDAVVGVSKFVDAAGAVHDTGERIRGLAKLWNEERDRLSRFCSLAVNAGLEARRIDAAARMGESMAGVLRLLMSDPGLALTGEQRAAFPGALRRVLGIASQPTIEGELL
jgi:hypothetical protein